MQDEYMSEELQQMEENNAAEYPNEKITERPYHKKEDRKLFSKIGWSLVVFLTVTTIFQFGVSMLITEGVITLGDHAIDKIMALSMGSMYLVGFPAFLLMTRKIPSASKIPVKKWGFWKLSGTFIVCLGAVYIGNIIGQLLMYIVGLIAGKPMVNGLGETVNNMSLWLILLIIVIIAPIVEEIIFRKMLIDKVISYGEGTAVVLSGVLFGLMHGNFFQFFYACALGMIFGYIYVKTGKLLYTILFHMMINFIGSFLPMLLLKLAKVNFAAGLMLLSTMGLFIFGFIGTGIALLIWHKPHITFDAGPITIPKGSRFKTVFLNVGMILYVLICTAMFLLA